MFFYIRLENGIANVVLHPFSGQNFHCKETKKLFYSQSTGIKGVIILVESLTLSKFLLLAEKLAKFSDCVLINYLWVSKKYVADE